MSKIGELYKVGFTTGACAQAAAKAAAVMLIKGRIIDSIEVELPNRQMHTFTLLDQQQDKNFTSCAVIKDTGSDTQDVTAGIKICAWLKRESGSQIRITAGVGVGKATIAGLAVAPGEWAINPVPKKMIVRDLKAILPEGEGFCLEISVPEGEAIAKRTYNPRLGIEGGISIIGRRGTVIPKSETAYKDTIKLLLNVASQRGQSAICLAAGSIAEETLKKRLSIKDEYIVTIADHLGFALQNCLAQNIIDIVYIGHIGKVAKVAAGLFNTHCSYGDARLETIAAHAAALGAKQKLISKLMELKLAEASIDLLKDNGLICVFERIAEAAAKRLQTKFNNKMNIAVVALGLSGEVIGSYPTEINKKQIWQKYQLSE